MDFCTAVEALSATKTNGERSAERWRGGKDGRGEGCSARGSYRNPRGWRRLRELLGERTGVIGEKRGMENAAPQSRAAGGQPGAVAGGMCWTGDAAGGAGPGMPPVCPALDGAASPLPRLVQSSRIGNNPLFRTGRGGNPTKTSCASWRAEVFKGRRSGSPSVPGERRAGTGT